MPPPNTSPNPKSVDLILLDIIENISIPTVYRPVIKLLRIVVSKKMIVYEKDIQDANITKRKKAEQKFLSDCFQDLFDFIETTLISMYSHLNADAIIRIQEDLRRYFRDTFAQAFNFFSDQ